MQQRGYNILFWALLLLLLFHFLFSSGVIKDKELSGYYRLPGHVELNPENLFSGKFQDSAKAHIDHGMGMYPAFTRLHHHLEFTLFDKVHVKDVRVGERNYLFRWCDGCMTEKTFDAGELDRWMDKYETFSDSMKKSGKEVLWLIAPDKNMVFSEYLPRQLQHPVEIYRYYWDLKRAFASRRIPVIDFNELCFREREKFEYPVYNKGGIHWTSAYALRCYDSVCSRLSETGVADIQNKIRLYTLKHAWDPDIDMEAAANLLAPLQPGEYFHTKLESVAKSPRRKLLLIGDSFTYPWLWTGWCEQSFHPESEFWYYNREVSDLRNKALPRKVDPERAKDFDIVIFLFSAANAEYLDYGFLDSVYP